MVFSLCSDNLINATLACSNIPIPIVSKIKELGITLNPVLLWTAYVEELTPNVWPAVNFIKLLSFTHWDSDQITMALSYESFFRPKLDYSSILYASCSNTKLQST